MGVRQTVELRVSPDVTTAATVGWQKPVLLLSNDWALWTEAELKAVLAHELAHVRRADYAVWLLANVSMAVHFYHPLVYWLANRLKLQQELAADALGALHAGGADTYRRSLARLALRQDGLPLPGPARAFLPAQGTLMRRVAMLRDKDVARHARSSWKVRLGLPAFFGVVALGVSTLRLPAQQPAPVQNPPKAAGIAARTEFDRSYAPRDADGVLSFRPAEIIARPEIRQLVIQHGKELDSALTTLLETFNLSNDCGFPHIEEIEQVSVGIYFGFHPEVPAGRQHSITMYGIAIRTLQDFDWKKLVNSLPKASIEFTAIERNGRSYYKATKSPVPLGPMTLCVLTPDSRTLVFDTEKNIQALLDSKNGQEVSWPNGWNRVSRSLIALTLENENNRYGSWLKDDPTMTPEYAELLKNVQQIVVGIDGQEELTLDLRARCGSPAAAESLIASLKKGMAMISFLANVKSDADVEEKAVVMRMKTLLGQLASRANGVRGRRPGKGKDDALELLDYVRRHVAESRRSRAFTRTSEEQEAFRTSFYVAA